LGDDAEEDVDSGLGANSETVWPGLLEEDGEDLYSKMMNGEVFCRQQTIQHQSSSPRRARTRGERLTSEAYCLFESYSFAMIRSRTHLTTVVVWTRVSARAGLKERRFSKMPGGQAEV
jgi:hypothetical protein